MKDSKGFDDWSGDYDQFILDNMDSYPFKGYYTLLSFIRDKTGHNAKILDLGVGTGLLTHELYKNGSDITGVDFSEKMIEEAKKKMQGAEFFCLDLNKTLPENIRSKKFDFIVSSYAIHHLTDERKVSLIRELLELLEQDGSILFGDVAFEASDDMEKCSIESGDEWDDEEIYMVMDNIIPMLDSSVKAEFTKISDCSGVLEIKKR